MLTLLSFPFNMKNSLLRPGLLLLSGLCLVATLPAQTPAPKIDFPAASPAGSLKQRVGLTDVEVSYNRPSAKGRKVFGGLVAYGRVWRTGADLSTKFTFSTAVKLNGADVAAGTYEVFTIPGANEWTIILQKLGEKPQWGAYAYDEKKDTVRFKAVPASLPFPVESLAIGLNDLRADSATLTIDWERTRVPLKLTTDIKAVLVPQIEAALASGGDKLPYIPSAMFYYENGLDLKKALEWMDKGIAAADPSWSFVFVYRKGLIQEKAGDKAGALATAQAALEAASKGQGEIKAEYTDLITTLINRLEGKTAPAASPQNTGRLSPQEVTSAVVDGARLLVAYGRPHSRDPKTGEVRKIWGSLVPYGQVWRTGANEATHLVVQKDIVIGGTALAAGTYTLFTLPNADGTAELIINKQVGIGGAYPGKDDVARVALAKSDLTETVHQFTISVEANPAGGGVLKLMWENTAYAVPFTVKK